jgi:PAS domain S-box-containing protein
MVGVDLDITKHKQLEEQLRRNEERWQLALQGNNDGIWDWNIQTNEVFFSTRWKEMLGHKEHEISNHLDEWSKRVHPEDLEGVLQAVQQHLAKKTDFYVSEHRLQCKNGTYKWILDRGKALWDEEGNPIRMVGSHTDITERKATEQILKQQAIIFESISEGIVITDLEGQIIDYNPAAEKMFGYSYAEVIGKTPAMFHPPEESSRLTPNVLASIQQHKFWSGEIAFIRKDGTEGISEVVIVPLENESGKVLATIGINRDITEKKRREKILHNIMLGVSAKTGTAFFELLVKCLSQALNVEYAFIGEVVEFTNDLDGKNQPSRIKTIAGYGKGKLMDNFEYDLVGTPCEKVFNNQIVVYCDRLQQKFPQDRFLVEMDAESYLGKSLFNSQGQNLGLIAVIDNKPLVDVEWMKEVIQIFAIRVSSELERRQVEYHLKQQAQIIDQIHDSVVATDIEGNITSWNKGAERLFGYQVDEVIGRHIGLVYRQDQQEFLQNQIIAPLLQQEVHDIEVLMTKKSGKSFDAHLSLSLQKDESNNVIGMIGYSRDISDRKRAEKRLQSQMRRSQLFAEISLKIRQSLQLEEILQTTVVEIQKLLNADQVLILRLEASTSLSIIQETVKPGWDSALELGFFVDNCLGSQYLLKYPQGRLYNIPDVENSDVEHCLLEFLRRFQVKSKLVIPLLFQEKLWGMIVIHQCSHTRNWSSWEIDLLQQIANQLAIAIGQSYLVRELSSSKQRWATLTETVPVGIFLTDSQGNCLYINQLCSEITGIKAQSVSGQEWFKFLHPEDRCRVVIEWKQAIAKHFPFACEHRFVLMAVSYQF